jgi:hypothetical protein
VRTFEMTRNDIYVYQDDAINVLFINMPCIRFGCHIQSKDYWRLIMFRECGVGWEGTFVLGLFFFFFSFSSHLYIK